MITVEFWGGSMDGQTARFGAPMPVIKVAVDLEIVAVAPAGGPVGLDVVLPDWPGISVEIYRRHRRTGLARFEYRIAGKEEL